MRWPAHLIMEHYYPLLGICITCRIICASLFISSLHTPTHTYLFYGTDQFCFALLLIKEKLPSVVLILIFNNMKHTTVPTFDLSLYWKKWAKKVNEKVFSWVFHWLFWWWILSLHMSCICDPVVFTLWVTQWHVVQASKLGAKEKQILFSFKGKVHTVHCCISLSCNIRHIPKYTGLGLILFKGTICTVCFFLPVCCEDVKIWIQR